MTPAIPVNSVTLSAAVGLRKAPANIIRIQGIILPDKIKILFTDAPFEWEKDRAILTWYAEELQVVIQRALNAEEEILIALHQICHVE